MTSSRTSQDPPLGPPSSIPSPLQILPPPIRIRRKYDQVWGTGKLSAASDPLCCASETEGHLGKPEPDRDAIMVERGDGGPLGKLRMPGYDLV